MIIVQTPLIGDKMIGRNLPLTKESDLDLIAQNAVETHYHIPYPGKPDLTREIARGEIPKRTNRRGHSGPHVTMAAHVVDLMLSLYQDFGAENHPAKQLTEKEIKLLKLAVIYHDAGNINDSKTADGTEKPHAKIFRRDMFALGYTSAEIAPFADAIVHKNHRYGESKNIFARLVHDADCLEVLRMRRLDRFDKGYLDIVKEFEHNPVFQALIDDIVINHKKASDELLHKKDAEGRTLRTQIDYAPNCFNATKDFLQARYNAMNPDIEISSHLNPIDLFSGISGRARKARIETKRAARGKAGTDIQTSPYTEAQNRLMEAYQNEGMMFRGFSKTRSQSLTQVLNGELAQLKKNKSALQRAGVNSNEKLRERYLNDEMVDGFKFRPSSLIHQDANHQLFKHEVGFIYNPRHAETYTGFAYKVNVGTQRIGSPKGFNFPKPIKNSGVKDKETFEAVRDKAIEQENRRRGLTEDKGLRYYGDEKLRWSEFPAHYTENTIEGIVIIPTAKAAQEALQTAERLGKVLPYFKYEGYNLVPVRHEEVVALANSRAILEIEPDIINILDDNEIENLRQIKMSEVGGVKIFRFTHPRDRNAQCTMLMDRDGCPVLKMTKDGETTLHKIQTKGIQQSQLRQVATQYANLQTQKLQSLLETDEVKTYLASQGIEKLSVHIVQPHQNKFNLGIGITYKNGVRKNVTENRDFLRSLLMLDTDDSLKCFGRKDYEHKTKRDSTFTPDGFADKKFDEAHQYNFKMGSVLKVNEITKTLKQKSKSNQRRAISPRRIAPVTPALRNVQQQRNKNPLLRMAGSVTDIRKTYMEQPRRERLIDMYPIGEGSTQSILRIKTEPRTALGMIKNNATGSIEISIRRNLKLENKRIGMQAIANIIVESLKPGDIIEIDISTPAPDKRRFQACVLKAIHEHIHENGLKGNGAKRYKKQFASVLTEKQLNELIPSPRDRLRTR